MLVAFKRFGFIFSIGGLAFLSACAAFKPDKFEGFYVNNIPSSAEIHRTNYDLSFALTFTNKFNGKNNQTEFIATYGTGWLIDWKEGGQKNGKNEPFRAYIATNLHVADGLKNKKDYEPYNKETDNKEETTAFRIGKYTNAKDFVLPSKVNLANNAQVFVNVQTTVIPKTAFTARDFVNYKLSADEVTKQKKQLQELIEKAQKGEVQEGQQTDTQAIQWQKKNDSNVQIAKSQSDSKDKGSQDKSQSGEGFAYADFAVLELPLFLENQNDKKVFDHFIEPAMRTYKLLGDSLNLFAKQSLDELKGNHYYLAGYPYLKNKVRSLFINQTDKTKKEDDQIVQHSNIDKPFDIRPSLMKPTLIRNKGDDFNDSTLAWDYDHSKIFQLSQTFQNQYYQQYGKGLVLTNAGFEVGASGSLVLNDKKQIAGIYFGTTYSDVDAWGVAQLLRWKAMGNQTGENSAVAYDLIFGNKDTTKYYAQFAKKNSTHFYKQIEQAKDQSLKYVQSDKTTDVKNS
ncbi:DUF31 family protein [Mycoplasmoides pneumoniae]|uniref:Lipoprotein n=2 Tax=Mycoplasmoides pneumoniae TaxID=2104 RepID=A0AAX0S5Q8_MYCPM|nr:DUF31 family protein [Mycoplasmoides pneumoniae]ALA30751.1 hypothetical protein B434_00990 [Mycoplasmoides pneumoniae 19294]ALA31853.1 hypothetical protein F536_03320 [Mycoplasmoides pneumoniae 39443]ALA36085.1 hypothetical protein F539_03325 [Mycoplasmoides pneumoniae FH]ALA36795.1 hypothetical protein F538_03340 [Mycoplasmoides pneumoniae M1139]ALA37506.1 hypothetical protein RF41_03305 [Mycoplasmoides pneumoniae]